MRIGIIGPGDVKKYCTRAGIDESTYRETVKKIAGWVAESGNDIVVTPDFGSTTELFALEYLAGKGKKVIEIVPLEDKEFGFKWVNTSLGENISCGTWRNQPESLCENSDLLICIGWGGGTSAEIYYTRWFGKVAKVYIVEDLIDGKLPKSLNDSLGEPEYISGLELEKKLKAGKI
jgi:hypothetical protein